MIVTPRALAWLVWGLVFVACLVVGDALASGQSAGESMYPWGPYPPGT
jgi:hypothetical protein